jgi:2-oxoglutarate dehydrogenase E2 component (dihydrolipoamide succinyltransferase)
MALDIRLPGLGESIAEGTIVRWLRQPGDRVVRDEDLVLVNTDKIEVALPCPRSGVLTEHLLQPGETARVGAVIARMEADAATAGPAAPSVPMSAPPGTAVGGRETSASSHASKDLAARNLAFRAGGDGKLFTSPAVRRLAREHDIDLSLVEGTGARGRVTRRDVDAFVAAGGGKGFVAPEGGFRPGARLVSRAGLPFPAAVMQRYGAEVGPGDRVEVLSSTGRAMAEHMAYTWWRSPHVSTLIEIDMARVAEHRRAANALVPEGGIRLSYTHYVARAVALALRRHPGFNASMTEDFRRLLHRDIHLGVAVARPDGGLLVPVLREAETLSLRGIAEVLERLAARARSGGLGAADLQGGTFSLTNVGSNGNLASWPLIAQPQCAILAMGAVTKRVVVVTDRDGQDAMAIRPMMMVTLTYDHRLNDGAASGRFLGELRRTLEQWSEGA